MKKKSRLFNYKSFFYGIIFLSVGIATDSILFCGIGIILLIAGLYRISGRKPKNPLAVFRETTEDRRP